MSQNSRTFRPDGFLDEFRDGARIRARLARSARWFGLRAGATDATTKASGRGHLGVLSTAFLVVITLGYLGAEVMVNVHLQELVSKVGASQAEADSLSLVGRWLFAFGLVWALLRSMVFDRRSGHADSVINLILFSSAMVVSFTGITWAYNKAIDSLAASASMQAVELATHRNRAQTKSLEPARQARVDLATKDTTSQTLWALYAIDPVVAADAHAEYEGRRLSLATDNVSGALALYPKIEAARKKSAAAGPELVEFEKRYADYIAKSKKVESYRSGAFGLRDQATTQFAEATCGMLPNGNATRIEFAQEMTKSCVLNFRRGGQAYLASGLASTDDPYVYSRDGINVRYSQVKDTSEAQFTTFVREQAASIVDQHLPLIETVKDNKNSHDLIASVVLPPLSMLLSMLSIVANAGGALALMAGLKRLQGVAAMLAMAVAALLIPVGSPSGMTQAWSAFAAEHHNVAVVAGKVITAERFMLYATRGVLSW